MNTHRLLRCAGVAAWALALTACGGSEPAAATPSGQLAGAPIAEPADPGCALDASPPLDEGALAMLERSSDMTGARERYLIDGYGEVRTSGRQISDANDVAMVPDPVDADRAAGLRRELQQTGIYELRPGCYAEELGDYDTRAVTLTLPYRGQVLRYATLQDEGPLPLIAAVDAVESYVFDNLTADAEELEEATETPPSGETSVEVVAP